MENNNEGKSLDAYDLIVIGIGERGKSTMKQLNKQGKDVMYIELTPDMLTTMICHQPPKQDDRSLNDRKKNNDTVTNAKIHLQKQSMQTPAGETITYTFHVSEQVVEEVALPKQVPEAEVSNTTTHTYQEIAAQEHTPKADNPYPYLTWPDHIETPKKTAPANVKNLFAFDEDEFDHSEIDTMSETGEYEEIETIEVDSISNESDEESNDYFTFFKDSPIESVEDGFDDGFDKKDNPFESDLDLDSELGSEENHSLRLLQKLKPSSLSQQQAEEILMREQLLSKKKITSSSNLFERFEKEELDYPTAKKPVEKTTPLPSEENTSQVSVNQPKIEQSSLLDSVLSKPVYSPKESRLRKRPKKQPNIFSSSDTQKPKLIPSSQPPIQMEQTKNHSPVLNKSIEDPQNIHAIEPFSTRRRARVQKKQRILSTVERYQGNKMSSHEVEDTLPVQQETNFTSTDSENFFQQATFQKPKPKPINYEDFSETNPLEMVESNESDSLKRDNIEFEEAYGYNSWEEFMYPSSQNSRKRQGMDKIQKRKIALRGLHNLINNLG